MNWEKIEDSKDSETVIWMRQYNGQHNTTQKTADWAT
jgi:hypothetical protein